VHLTVVLTNVVIGSYQAGSGGSDPIESFSLDFAGIEFQPAE
jgi:type VI protein secretion system component Hcp